MKVQIQFPDGSLRTYKFDNDTLKFTPANLSTGDNTATIDLSPSLTGQAMMMTIINSCFRQRCCRKHGRCI